MSRSIPSKFPLSEVSDILDPHPIRDPGFHVTDLIRVAAQMSKGKSIEREDFKENNLMSWGRIWEAAVRPWTKNYCAKFGMKIEFEIKRERDGILASLDGRCKFPDSLHTFAVIEMKATTVRDPDPTQNWERDHQARSYCYIENTTLAWFLMLHGTSRPPDFQPYLYQVEYEQWELNETWEMILRMRDYMQERQQQ